MNFQTLLDSSDHILCQGSMYELLRRNPEVVFDEHISHAGFIYNQHHRKVLERVFRAYIDIAVNFNMPMAVGAATWRANKERIKASAFAGHTVNEDNVRFLNEIRDSYSDAGISILIIGDVGPRGDAYCPEDAMDTNSAQTFHAYQIERLASCKVDFLQACTLPAISEAIGIALAMAKTDIPYALSFVVERTGCLLDGTKLSDAMRQIDDAVGDGSARYAINCVHPSVLHMALDHNPQAVGRIISFCGNTSELSPDELDGREELDTQDPSNFALVNKKLLDTYNIPIIGACCGSGPDHISEIAKILL